jgi:hypothetical protein
MMMTLTGSGTALLKALRRDGIVSVPGLSTDHVDAIWEDVRECPRYAGHVKREGQPPDGRPITCWDMHDLMLAPYFWEWAVSFTPLAAQYLCIAPLLYSMNLFESTPSDWDPHPGIEAFHRDYDDTRFLALFLYLTDVYPGDGSHVYQCGTADGGPMTRTEEVCGPRGTAFIADTRGFHRGLRPTSGPRRMAWARWGVTDPPASYLRDRLQPLPRARLGYRYPTDPELQRLVRLVVA